MDGFKKQMKSLEKHFVLLKSIMKQNYKAFKSHREVWFHLRRMQKIFKYLKHFKVNMKLKVIEDKHSFGVLTNELSKVKAISVQNMSKYNDYNKILNRLHL